MVVLVVKFDVKVGKKEEFLSVMKPLIEGSVNEDGCLQYELFIEDELPNSFVLFEKWKDQNALDFHNSTDHFVTYAPKLGELCEKISMNRYGTID